MLASCWVARKIFLSAASASSSARTLDSRPTTNGVIMYGKMTTSRMGIIGRRRVSVFSLEVSMRGVVSGQLSVVSCQKAHRRSSTDNRQLTTDNRQLAGLLEQRHVDLLCQHHL